MLTDILAWLRSGKIPPLWKGDRSYIAFRGAIAQSELAEICKVTNQYLVDNDFKFRITNHMGELRHYNVD